MVLPMFLLHSVSYDVYIGFSYDVFIGVSYDVYIGVSYDVYIGFSYDVYIGVSYDVYIGVSYDVYIGVSANVSTYSMVLQHNVLLIFLLILCQCYLWCFQQFFIDVNINIC